MTDLVKPNARRSELEGALVFILAAFFLAAAYHAIQSTFFSRGYPWDTFLFIPTDRFADFYVLVKVCRDFDPYFGHGSAQFPFTNLLFCGFARLPMRVGVFVYEVGLASFTVFFLWSNFRHLGNRLALAAALAITGLTYPVLFTLDRGNIEGLLFIVLGFFAGYLARGRWTAAAIFLGIAIALKGFPVVFLVLFVPERRWKPLLIALVVAGVLTVGALATFTGGFMANLKFMLGGQNFAGNSTLMAFLGQNHFVQRGMSLFTWFKIVFCELRLIDHINMARFLSIYKIAAALVYLAAAAYIVFRGRTLWKNVALLVSLMLLLPHISADYKLIHLLIPFALFFSSSENSRWSTAYVAIFCLLLIPKSYYLLGAVWSDSGASDISSAVLLNPILLAALCVLVIAEDYVNKQSVPSGTAAATPSAV